MRSFLSRMRFKLEYAIWRGKKLKGSFFFFFFSACEINKYVVLVNKYNPILTELHT